MCIRDSLRLLPQRFAEVRAVRVQSLTGEDNWFTVNFQSFSKGAELNRRRRDQHLEAAVRDGLAPVEGAVNLVAAGIEQGADQGARRGYRFGQGLQGGDAYRRYGQALGQRAGGGNADADSGKRTGTGRNGDSLQLLAFDGALLDVYKRQAQYRSP